MEGTDLSAIERRLRALEDQIAIYQIVCGYGYAVDGLNGEVVGSFYAPDGVYAVSGVPPFVGREVMAAIVELPQHVELVRGGCAHASTLPHVVIEGDRASATCHFWIIKNTATGPAIFRPAASRLELSRKPDGGWQIDHRQNRLLDGDPEASAMLGRLREPPAPAAT